MNTFHKDILAGIPAVLPEPKPYDTTVNHAPKRKEILSAEEKMLAIKNALRYFPQEHHAVLAAEFAQELKEYGRIYMYRFRPDYEMYARPIDEYPAKSKYISRENAKAPTHAPIVPKCITSEDTVSHIMPN